MKAMKARMKLSCCAAGLLLAYFCVSPSMSTAQSTGGVQAEAVVTVMAKSGKESRPVTRDAVNVVKGEVESWTPFTGDRAGLQLLILLDDSSSGRVDSQLADIKHFIVALPATTEIAIGYMQNGRASIAQNFTVDHAAAAQTVRSTLGSVGGNGSPYFVLQDVIKRWPSEPAATPKRREILMVTDGVDRYTGARFDPEDQYVSTAIHEAQLAGVVIHSIYFRGAGRLDSNQEVVLGGQSYLEQVAKGTGGKCYTEGIGNPVSFAPMLDELNERLQNQYELRFVTGQRVEHDLVPLKLKIQAAGANVDAPDMARLLASEGMK